MVRPQPLPELLLLQVAVILLLRVRTLLFVGPADVLEVQFVEMCEKVSKGATVVLPHVCLNPQDAEQFRAPLPRSLLSGVALSPVDNLAQFLKLE